jgi:sugar phosphate isomerase/epimerase
LPERPCLDPAAPTILLGTVALEPNRWGTIDRSRHPVARISPWLEPLHRAGFDGLEIWDRHLTEPADQPTADSSTADSSAAAPAETETQAILDGPLPIVIFNSYVSLDDHHDGARRAVADWVRRSGARGVKFNVGNDPSAIELYVERIRRWLRVIPSQAMLLCECHAGISIAEDPVVAAAIFDALGESDRLGAIVHTHESADHLRSRFAAYGDRIRHVHVNYLRTDPPSVPELGTQRSDLGAKVELLRSLGFEGTWTIEFVAGVLSDRDRPELLAAQAIADLGVLREVLA